MATDELAPVDAAATAPAAIASTTDVEPIHGRIVARTQGWFCRSPVVPGTTIESLLQALQGEAPLYAALPSSSKTLFDGLVDCL